MSNRVSVPGENIVLRVPQVALRLARFFALLLSLLLGRNVFRFLISDLLPIACHVGALATDKERQADHQGD
ncbi:MAG: hypothetical protein QOG67_2059 [Verrucomicrobiota bacterium]|jgi:hypothetical protein